LVIGTGADGRLPVMPEVRDLAEARGVELIELPTIEACLAARCRGKGGQRHPPCHLLISRWPVAGNRCWKCC
jgi:hypothetical protein